MEAERALCLSVSQDCGFSLEDPLRETHCTGGHPALVRGHGIILDYYVVLYLVGSASRACPLCHSVSQDCGFSLEDPLHETHCTGGHPALVRGHGIILDYYVVLYLVGSASRACPLCHSVSQDCGFSLEDPLHETHCIGEHSTLVSVRYCFADCNTIQDRLLNKATLGFWCLAPFTFVGSCLKQCHVEMMRGIIGMMIWGFLQAGYNNK